MLAALGFAQDPTKPVLRPGISVHMPVSNQAVQMPAADREDATVIAVTADGKIFIGTKPVEISSLAALNAATVYLKPDARLPLQKLLDVMDALHGKSIVLLTASKEKPQSGGVVPPFGIKLVLGQ